MIAKVIAYGDTRQEALQRMRNALDEIIIDGIRTNIALHRVILNDTGFIEGGCNIHYLEQRLQEN